MSAVEVLTGEVITPESALKELDAALDGYAASTIELGRCLRHAQVMKAWEDCEDFMGQMEDRNRPPEFAVFANNEARGIAPSVDWLASYCAYRGQKFDRSRVYQLAQSWQVVELLARGMEQLGESSTNGRRLLPSSERQARPLVKSLRALQAVNDEGEPVREDDVAINMASLWTEALRTKATPAKAAQEFPTLAKQTEFAPLRDAYRPLTAEERKANEAIVEQRTIDRVMRDMRWMADHNFRGACKLADRIATFINEEREHRG